MVHDLIQRLKTEYSDECFEELYRLYADRAIRTATAVTG
ncbi:RNA polymerase subunit sigma-24, partial [Clostridium perfringens]